MSPQPLIFILTAEDCAEASAVLARAHPMRRLGPILIVAVSLLVGGLIALATAKLGNPASARRAFGLGAALCAGFLGLQYLMLLRIALQTTRRSIEASPWFGREVRGRIDEAGLAFGEDQLTVNWADLRACREGPNLFALTSPAHPPLVIPKRALGEHAQILLRKAQVRA